MAAVTGGGAGIGRGIATALAAFGARVAILEMHGDRAARVARDIGSDDDALPLIVDVRDSAAVATAFDETVRHFGRIDILVNNAGGAFAAPFLETKQKGWAAMHRANLEHVFTCTQVVARHMIDRGGGGSVINVVSIEGVRAAPQYAAYAAAKAGAISATKTLALELAPHAIRVNALAPDICRTEGLSDMMGEEDLRRAALRVPLGRLGTPEDMGAAAVFLAGDMSRYLTGETLHVDGGTHAAGGWYRHPTDGRYVCGVLLDADETD